MDSTAGEEKFIWSISPLQWAAIGLAALLGGYIFLDGIKDMLNIWSASEEYGYGYLIPVISAFLVWQKKDVLETIRFSGSWNGVLLTFIGIFVFFIGYFATLYTIIEYGLVITVFGVALSVVGGEAFKKIWVPLLFLVFMIPLPNFIFQTLSSELQLISSEIGIMVIRAAGISVYLEGNVIDLGSFQLQVVEACSGLRYLFPLVTLTFMTVYFFRGPFWVRAIIFISSIPITVLMNSLRIGVIGILVEYGGPEQAAGFLHDFEGWVVFMVCIGIIIFEMWLFTRFFSKERSLTKVFGIDMPKDAPADTEIKPREFPLSLGATLALLLLSAATVAVVDTRAEIIPDRASFASFPKKISGWTGRQVTIEDKYLDVLQLDDYVTINYGNKDGDIVNFYTAYYSSQRAGVSAHSPRACIPGGGWKIQDLREKRIDDVANTGDDLFVNRLVIKKGDYTQLVYYWFQQRGRNITNEYAVKWYLLWDALTRSRTDGALVRLTTGVHPGEDIRLADERIIDFIKQVEPLMDEYVPR